MEGTLCTASAASFTASVSVGWAWQVRRDILGGGAELHGHRHLADHLAGVGADDVDAEHAVGRDVSASIFTKPSVWCIALARPLAVNGNLPTLVLDAGRASTPLRVLPTQAISGLGVYHVRNHAVVHVPGLAGEISATATPSSSALCASIGPAITSPMA